MPGVIGTLQALEAIKIAVGIKRILIAAERPKGASSNIIRI